MNSSNPRFTKLFFLLSALAVLCLLMVAMTPRPDEVAAQRDDNKSTNEISSAERTRPAPCMPQVSCSTDEPAFSIVNSGNGHGLYASTKGPSLQSGIVGDNLNENPGGYGVSGYSFGFAGVFGFGKSPKSHGVYGNVSNKEGAGVYGQNDGDNPTASWGVFGFSKKGFAGVFGAGDNNGVYGQTGSSAGNSAGIFGKNDGAGFGVLAIGNTGSGLFARSDNGGDGVVGEGRVANKSGVYGYTTSANGFGGFFQNRAGGVALVADGRAKIKVLEITGGGDLSEQFEINRRSSTNALLPGLVVSIDPHSPGSLVISSQSYDRRVAGIISGAGGINSGMLMYQPRSAADGTHPVALTGRVYCWADASTGAIEPGDLLTTSDTPGHAMKVVDYHKAGGAIIGKAMTALKQGKSLVLVLVSLQ